MGCSTTNWRRGSALWIKRAGIKRAGIGRVTAAAAALSIAMIASALAQAPLTPAQQRDLDQVNSYLNRLDKLHAEFEQTGPDGAISRGEFYLSRPGRMRFDYAQPDELLIVADGLWLAVQDGELNTVDRFPIKSTPLSLLLDEQINLGKSTQVASIRREGDSLYLTLQDPDAPEKGQVTLVFAAAGADMAAKADTLELKRWIVVDAQGLATQIDLDAIEMRDTLDPKLFIMRDPVPGTLHNR